MTTSILDIIRDRIRALYVNQANIHVNVTIKRPYKTKLGNLPVEIKGVYPHMFQVEYCGEGNVKKYMHQYTDLIKKKVEILEIPDSFCTE